MKGLFAAASAIALLAGVPAWAQNPASPQNPASLQALNSQDRMFLKQAGDGNLAEMKLGQLAMQKATSPAIKEFGRWMMTDHGFANVRLAAIGKRIGVANFQPKLTMQDQQMQQKLQGLSGEQFDRQYTQMMVRDHKETIPKFRKEEQDGQNRLLKTYAHNLLPVLHQHLAEAEQLASLSSVATGTTAPPAAMSGSSINAGAAARGMGVPPAAGGETVRGIGAPPGAAPGSSGNPSSPTHFYNR
jgi:putative membrane protein